MRILKEISMLRSSFIACALVASAAYAARPMIIHQSQAIEPPAGSGYYYFDDVAIDGDWAIILARTSPFESPEKQDAVLYHRVNGIWTPDRTLIHREWPDNNKYMGFTSVAMNNGVAVIGADPTRIFRRTGSTWAEIAHPFTAPAGDPDFVEGELRWDGNTLLAARYAGCPWGALISRLNADGSWSPVEHLSASGGTACNQQPVNWSISGNTVLAGTYSNDYQVSADQLWIFRRSGTTWTPTSVIDRVGPESDVRGDEMFVGTLVYRNDDSQTVIDTIRSVSDSTLYGERDGANLAHTNDVFKVGHRLFRKNAAGKYEHVAMFVPTGGYSLGDVEDALNGQRYISTASRDFNPASLIFDLPATYTPSAVIATGFESGSSPFTPQAGTFAVASTTTGNHVYRQSSVTGDYRALLGNSDWVEQSIEADIKPTAFSGTDRWAGMAVRYLDDANYYYVTLRSSGVVSLKRMRNGAFTTVAQKALPIVAGRSYRVGLQAWTTEIRVFIDGKQFIGWSEPELIPHGSVALLGYRTAADYDNVVAAQVGQRGIFDLSVLPSCDISLNYEHLWTINGTGNWSCPGFPDENVMQQTSTVGVARALVGAPTDDQVVQTRARATAFEGQDRWFGIAARYTNESNYYYLAVRNSNTVSLRKLVNGAITVLGTATLTVTPNTWYDLRLDAVGNELRAFVNGVQVLQTTDASHPSGKGGILTYKTGAEFAGYIAWQP
jgi:hypothetical protein